MLRFLPNHSRPLHPKTTVISSSNATPSTDNRLIRRQSTYERAALSPFDLLPLELHAEIFSHVIPAFPHLNTNGEALMILARVCGTWRSLVLATPKLWASFEIEVQDASEGGISSDSEPLTPHTSRLLRSVEVWLERSQSYPLSIRFIHMPTTRTPNSISAQLLAMLTAHAHRWRNVEFTLPSTNLSESQGMFTEEMPLLRHLKIHMKGQWHRNGGINSLLAMNIPWGQLTTVDLRLDHAHLLNLDELANLLQGATNLVSCSVNATCIMTAESARRRSSIQDRLHMPALERLHLILQGGNPQGLGLPNAQSHPPLAGVQSPFLRPEQSLSIFLGLFSDSKLTHLHLDWMVDPFNTPTTAPVGSRWEASSYSSFRSLLRTLSPTLHSLRLAYLPLGEEQLRQSLAQLSSTGTVRELDLRFPIADQAQDPITDSLLKSLTRPVASAGGIQVLAERKRNAVAHKDAPAQPLDFAGLQKLHIYCSGERCNQKSVTDMVDSRMEGGIIPTAASLTQVHFHSMYPIMRDTSRHIGAWAKAGIDAKFESVVTL